MPDLVELEAERQRAYDFLEALRSYGNDTGPRGDQARAELAAAEAATAADRPAAEQEGES